MTCQRVTKEREWKHQEPVRCNRPAHWKTIDGELICGLHKNSVDKYYARIKQSYRCEKI